eukprot:354792_1
MDAARMNALALKSGKKEKWIDMLDERVEELKQQQVNIDGEQSTTTDNNKINKQIDAVQFYKQYLETEGRKTLVTTKHLPIASIILFVLISIYTFTDFKWDLRSFSCLSEANLQSGKIWTLITYAFVHLDFQRHYLLNMIVYTLNAWFVNRVVGNKWFLIIFFGSTIVSGLSELWLGTHAELVGASGAINGICAAFITIFVVYFKEIRAERNIGLMVRWDIWPMITGFGRDILPAISNIPDGVGHWCHIGGFISGIVLLILFHKCKGINEEETQLSAANKGEKKDGAPQNAV